MGELDERRDGQPWSDTEGCGGAEGATVRAIACIRDNKRCKELVAALSDAVGAQQSEGEAALQSAHAAKEEAHALVLKARGDQHESVLEARAVEHAAQMEQMEKEADRTAEIEARVAKADQEAAVAELTAEKDAELKAGSEEHTKAPFAELCADSASDKERWVDAIESHPGVESVSMDEHPSRGERGWFG
jgi:hypothetical protein